MNAGFFYGHHMPEWPSIRFRLSGHAMVAKAFALHAAVDQLFLLMGVEVLFSHADFVFAIGQLVLGLVLVKAVLTPVGDGFTGRQQHGA